MRRSSVCGRGFGIFRKNQSTRTPNTTFNSNHTALFAPIHVPLHPSWENLERIPDPARRLFFSSSPASAPKMTSDPLIDESKSTIASDIGSGEDDHELFSNMIAPTAEESLARLIEYRRQRQDESASPSVPLSTLEYRVLRQILQERNAKLIEQALFGYPWSEENMWNYMIGSNHVDGAKYAWKVMCVWNETKPEESTVAMYQWGLSALAYHGDYPRALKILQYLNKQQQPAPDITCYHYGLEACNHHIPQKQKPPSPRRNNRKATISATQGSEMTDKFQNIQTAAQTIFEQAPHPLPINTYRTYLTILANDPVLPMGQRALQVFQEMTGSKEIVEPDLLCFNLVLKALAKEGNYDACTQVLESILLVKEELRDVATTATTSPPDHDDNTALDLNTRNIPNMKIAFHTVLKAFYEANTVAAANQAEQVLEIMWKVANLQKRPDYEPSARTYAQIIGIWTKLAEPQRAMTLLEELQNLYKQNKHYNSKFFPDEICYRNVIGSLSKLQEVTPEIAEQATLVLRNMNDMGHDINHMTINTVLKCWAKAGKPREAERLLDEVSNAWGIPPDIVAYNTILSAHARQGSADRARELLDRLLNNYCNTATSGSDSKTALALPRPNTVTFTTVIAALAKQKATSAAEWAERLLLQMQDLYEEHGLETRPNIVTYNAVLHCWASIEPNNVKATVGSKRAQLILQGMQDSLPANEQPNVISYNTVLQAYYSDLSRAEDLIQDMMSRGIRPNDSTKNTTMGILHRDDSVRNKRAKAFELEKQFFQHIK